MAGSRHRHAVFLSHAKHPCTTSDRQTIARAHRRQTRQNLLIHDSGKFTPRHPPIIRVHFGPHSWPSPVLPPTLQGLNARGSKAPTRRGALRDDTRQPPQLTECQARRAACPWGTGCATGATCECTRHGKCGHKVESISVPGVDKQWVAVAAGTKRAAERKRQRVSG